MELQVERREMSNVMNEMVLRLKASIWSEKLQDETVTLEVKHMSFLTWWDHLKATHFPTWAIKRWPAKFKVIVNSKSHTFRTVALLPDFKYEAPKGVKRVALRSYVLSDNPVSRET